MGRKENLRTWRRRKKGTKRNPCDTKAESGTIWGVENQLKGVAESGRGRG